ncbi:MAG: bifunctional nuclease family protein [Fidelibacterota bacterium]
MKRFKIFGIALEPYEGSPIVVLKDCKSDFIIPIWIGLNEAIEIANQIKGIQISGKGNITITTTKPSPHDIINSILKSSNLSFEKIVISDIREHIYYAKLYLRKDKKLIKIDSRPSDALALAMKNKVPIYVSKRVIDKISMVRQESERRSKMTRGERIKDKLKNLDLKSFGHFKLT